MVIQAEEEKERLALENKQQAEQIEIQRPKVAFADAILSSPDSILVGELAKILCQRGYQTGEIRLYEQLRHEGYLCSSGSDYNMPMQRYLEMGLFEVTKGTRSGNGGVMRTTRTTKVTPKGCQYFINKFIHN
jgi:anti-repressor protein